MDAEERVLSMRVLAIDASAKTAACAVADGEQLLCERFADNGLTHSETLLPMVLEMLNESGISPASLDRIGVTAGRVPLRAFASAWRQQRGWLWRGAFPARGFRC